MKTNKCEYCSSNQRTVMLGYDKYYEDDGTNVTLALNNATKTLEVYGGDMFENIEVKINYCPFCRRKL